GVGTPEVEALGQFLGGLVERVVGLLPVDLADDVEGRIGHGSSSRVVRSVSWPGTACHPTVAPPVPGEPADPVIGGPGRTAITDRGRSPLVYSRLAQPPVPVGGAAHGGLPEW